MSESVEETPPETNVPETEVPETEVPQTEVPQTEVPQTEVPQTEVPQTEVPEIEVPQTEVPEIEVPQTEVPETEVPQTEVPETEVPETEVPETEVPETEVPQNEVPETKGPETEVPETKGPETKGPETKGPETKGPETKGAETKVPETRITFSEFELESLKIHNEYRRLHSVPDLKLNKEICQSAQQWADTLARDGVMHHSYNNKYGENIYTRRSCNPDYVLSPLEAIKWWYDEIKTYKFDESINNDALHFTQLIWKKTSDLGIGMSKNKKGQIFVVANYSPKGNTAGEFVENVPKPIKKK